MVRCGIKEWLNKVQGQTRCSWATLRARWSVTAALTLLATIVIGGLGLRYAYVQQQLAYRGMKLAQWTAQKDFLELCRDNYVRAPTHNHLLSKLIVYRRPEIRLRYQHVARPQTSHCRHLHISTSAG